MIIKYLFNMPVGMAHVNLHWGYTVNLNSLKYRSFLTYRMIGNDIRSKFFDPEWFFKENFCGRPKTWWVYTGYGKFIKMYSDALADCVRERTGWYIEPFGHEEAK